MSTARLPFLWGVPAALRGHGAWPVPGPVPLGWRDGPPPADDAPAHAWPARLLDGRRVGLRTARAGDADAMARFLEALSLDARYHRFHTPLRRFSAATLAGMVRVDARHHVLLAESVKAAPLDDGAPPPLLGEARWVVDDDAVVAGGEAEFALVVADAWQRVGLGRLLLQQLVATARARGLRRLHGDVLHDNAAMAALLRSVGGRFDRSADPRVRRAVIDLDEAPRR